MAGDAKIEAIFAPETAAVSDPNSVSEFGTYAATRSRVETYFDRTATRTWEQLTSDAPVSKIRETVRQGRDKMRALMLSRLPYNLTGLRILDAGCGPGVMTAELAARGAEVTGVDISPKLIAIARQRLDPSLSRRVNFLAGDMLSEDLGHFDHVLAMDSLIYYGPRDIRDALDRLRNRAPHVVYTVAPKTPLLMAMWYAGKAFPRSDRSPTMVPHASSRLASDTGGARLGRIAKGFYISEALEVRR
ncbi:MAG: magnesium protoporphyrin IX methyltransferase [Pseudomonadota bacterium]